MMTFTPYSTNIYVCMPRKIAPVQISILDIIDGNIKDEKEVSGGCSCAAKREASREALLVNRYYRNF